MPASIAAATTRRSRQYYTQYAAALAWRALGERDLGATLAQLREARRLTSTLAVAREVGHLLARAVRSP